MAAQDVLKKLLASKMKGANPQAAQALLAKMKGKGGASPRKAVPGIVGKNLQAMPKQGIPGGKVVKPSSTAPTYATPQAMAAMKKKRF